MTTPTCPGCGSKFSHSNQLAACKVCGLTDEVVSAGGKAVERWRRANRLKPRGGSIHRRSRAHGRPRGGSRKVPR